MFYASNLKRGKDGELSIQAIEPISETEFSVLMSAFEYMSEINPVNTAYQIMLRNAREFMYETSEPVLIEKYFKKKEHEKDIAINANRLISNFCTSMQTFVDYAEKAVKRKGKKSCDDFKECLKSLFDKEFSYRFFYKLRNFCVHYSYPYTSIQISAPDIIELRCPKKHLMEYTGWGAIVSKGFNDLPDMIDLREYIDHLLVLLTTIQLNVYLYYGEDIFKANKAIASFAENHHLSSPAILEIDQNNSHHIRPIPIDNVMNDMKMLEQHPNARISYVQQVSEMNFNQKGPE